jgi:hypothetical protein
MSLPNSSSPRSLSESTSAAGSDLHDFARIEAPVRLNSTSFDLFILHQPVCLDPAAARALRQLLLLHSAERLSFVPLARAELKPRER